MFALQVEKLIQQDPAILVGIGEIHNKEDKGKDELIDLASRLSSGLEAIQFLNPKLIAGPIHLLSAAQNAVNAWKGEYSIARSLDVEVALYASAQNQIAVALDTIGVSDNMPSIAFVMIAEHESTIKAKLEKLLATLGPEVIPPFPASKEKLREIKKYFQIEQVEIAVLQEDSTLGSQLKALSRCVVSRVSMVALDS